MGGIALHTAATFFLAFSMADSNQDTITLTCRLVYRTFK